MNEKTLQEQLDEVNAKLNAERDLGSQKDAEKIATLEQQQADLLKAIMDEEQAAAQTIRIAAQEEKVESIILPYDFNDLYSDSTANESIIEVVKMFQRQANAEHNAEVEQLVSRHRADVMAWTEREIQLQRQNSELQKRVDENNEQAIKDAQEFLRLEQQIAQLQLEKQDAEAKRDAAVAKADGLELMLSEKEAHIQTLRDEAAIGASKTINITAIEASDRLAKLVEESKSAKIKSAAELALESASPFRGKIVLDAVAPSALEVPTFLTSSDTPSGLVEAQPIVIPGQNSEVEFQENFQVPSGNEVDPGVAVEVGQTLKEAFRRIEELERSVYGKPGTEVA